MKLSKVKYKNILAIIVLALIFQLGFISLNKSLNLINLGILATVIVNILIIYQISLKLTKNNRLASLLPPLILAVTPLWPDLTKLNEPPQLFLAISSIFFLLSIYVMINLKILRIGLFFPIIAMILHPSAAILIPAFIGYFILIALEHSRIKIRKKEVIYASLSTTFIILISFLSINISSLKLQMPVFAELKHVIGLVPLYIGIAGAYFGIKNKNKHSLLLLSVGGSCLLLLFFKIIMIESLMLYIGLSFAALSSLMIKGFQKLIRISRFKKHEKKYILYIFIAVVISSLFLWV